MQILNSRQIVKMFLFCYKRICLLKLVFFFQNTKNATTNSYYMASSTLPRSGPLLRAYSPATSIVGGPNSTTPQPKSLTTPGNFYHLVYYSKNYCIYFYIHCENYILKFYYLYRITIVWYDFQMINKWWYLIPFFQWRKKFLFTRESLHYSIYLFELIIAIIKVHSIPTNCIMHDYHNKEDARLIATP